MMYSTLHYQKLIDSFVEGKMSATQFEAKYLHLFKHDHSRSQDAYPILSDLGRLRTFVLNQNCVKKAI